MMIVLRPLKLTSLVALALATVIACSADDNARYEDHVGTTAEGLTVTSGVAAPFSGSAPFRTSFTMSVTPGTPQLSVRLDGATCTMMDVYAPGSTAPDATVGINVSGGGHLGAIGALAAGTWTFTTYASPNFFGCTSYSGSFTVTHGAVIQATTTASWSLDDGYAPGQQSNDSIWGMGTGGWVYVNVPVPAGQGVFQVDATEFGTTADFYLNKGVPPTLTSFYQGLKNGGGAMGTASLPRPTTSWASTAMASTRGSRSRAATRHSP